MLVHGRLLIDPAQPPPLGWVEIEEGRISAVEEGSPPSRPDCGGPESIITPGFIDAHVHLPQIDSIGCEGGDLLQWLDEVIYPAESRWSDRAFAEAHAREAYRRLLRAGTLGYAGYLSSHAHGLAAVTRAAHQMPLRAIVGQSLMDREGPPELLDQRPARLLRSEKGRLDASLNPRFAVSCSDALLERIGGLLAEGFPFSFKQRDPGAMGTTLFLQTHLAETRSECARVRKLFPDDPNYAAVYDRHGLLTQHTLLAHCLHLNDAEWDLIARRGSVVVHCPGANTFLRSGVFDLRAARERSVRVALGSDVAAGCDLAMPRVARAMIEVAKLRRLTVDRKSIVPTPAEAWSIITRGNADALAFADLGRLEVGASADLLVLRPPFEIDRHLFGRLIHTWRRDYITHRIVRGRVVNPDPPGNGHCPA